MDIRLAQLYDDVRGSEQAREVTGMDDEISFPEFVRRIRSGDAAAAAELVRRYEPAIRLEVRMRISDPRLGKLFD